MGYSCIGKERRDSMWTLIILGIIIAYSLWVIVRQVMGKKNGASSCGASCSGCASSAMCNKDLYKEFKKDHPIKSTNL